MNYQKAFLIEDIGEYGLSSKGFFPKTSNVDDKLQPSSYRIFDDITFNQDGSFFVCLKGNIRGQTVLQIFDKEPLRLKLERLLDGLNINDKVISAEVYHRSNLIFLLLQTKLEELKEGKSTQRTAYTLKIWDDLRSNVIFEIPDVLKWFISNKKNQFLILTSNLTLRNFKIKSDRIKEFYIPEIKTLNGSLDFKKQVLVFPSPNKVGQIQIAKISFDLVDHNLSESIIETKLTENERKPSFTTTGSNSNMQMGIFKAHKNPIINMKINNAVTKVATCSDRGTIIRVFHLIFNKTTINASLICEFKRGMEKAKIYEMQWSLNDRRIACISNKNTLHIFQLQEKYVSIVGDNGENNDTTIRFNIPGTEDADENEERTDEINKNTASRTQANNLQSTASNISTIHNEKHEQKTHTSICSFRPKDRVVGDRCKLRWKDDNTVILVWIKSGVWEKYGIRNTSTGYDIKLLDWKYLY